VSTDQRFGNIKIFILVAIPVVIILLPFGYSLYNFVFARDAQDAGPFLELPAEPNEGCVRETEYMRFHHWELLRQVRDESVRSGVRGGITLSGCRECHVNRERFCNRCHEAVSMELDCFGCHYYPASPAADPAGEAHTGEGVSEAWTAGTS